MFTTSADDGVTVQVTPGKWKPGDAGAGGSRAWIWAGDLPDVTADEHGVYVYAVPEGQWLDVHMVNRGTEVSMWVEQERMRQYGMKESHQYAVELARQGEAWTSRFRVGGAPIELRLRDFRRGSLVGPILMHLRFESVSAGGVGDVRDVGCLLQQLYQLGSTV